MSRLLKHMNSTRDRNISVLIPGGLWCLARLHIILCKIREYHYICSYLLTTIMCLMHISVLVYRE